jgi:hypothetical protein
MKRGRKIVIGALVCAPTFFGICLPVLAQPGQSARMADYVSPSLLSADAQPRVAPAVGAGTWNSDDRDIIATHSRASTAGDRWEAFEREYGIHQKNPSWFLSMLQSAKYELDKLSFGAKETARRLEFTYDIGSPTSASGTSAKPQYSLPLFGRFGHAQLKTVLTEHDRQTGTAFVGLKLSIPFGEDD